VTRQELEHLIRAAASVADEDDLVVVGSQAVLGQFPTAPAELLRSTEADLYPRDAPEKADLIDGSIGEGSPFHDTFGYYAQGVGPETAVLPAGWEGRLIPISNANTRHATGWSLEIHDLIISKYVAGRDKDRLFIRAAVAHRMVDRATLLARLAATPLDEARRAGIAAAIEAGFREAASGNPGAGDL